ncbi:helix-turn-helix domain-containing protein [Oceanicola sp. S124]|uniref:helix-turn-helix domain-containing protein n=1 Tax=Oceanicola sp. S124 TaxID=1042378 RepID=UPI000255A9C3|nr:helix-turn-helix domain-containing protein [Oceanicola sp. S124]
MSWEVANRCNKRKFGSASRKQVIMFLADKASDDGEGVYCSKHNIAKFTELSLATVKRIIRDFTAEGILVQTGERDCDFGYTNEYRICLEAVSRLDDLTKKKSDAQGGRQQTGVTKTPDVYDPASEVTTTPPPGSSRPPNHPKTIQKPPTGADTREEE